MKVLLTNPYFPDKGDESRNALQIDASEDKVNGKTVYDIRLGAPFGCGARVDYQSLIDLQHALNTFMSEAARVAYVESWGENP